MFLEPLSRGHRSGWIEVMTGSMFSGKTEELIRRLRRTQFAHQNLIIYKPRADSRYSKDRVVSHDSNFLESKAVQNASQILFYAEEFEVVGIDEAQFFDDELINVCNELANRGKRVIVAGLDMDFTGKPFGPIPQLMATAEYVTKVHAICIRCGNLANYSHRTTQEDKLVLLGETDAYEPLCRKCFIEANTNK